MFRIAYKLKDLPQIASKIIEEVPSKTLLFYGEMGVGKTTLIKELVKQLGSDDTVSSPTFSLVNEYQSKKGPLFHFDFYRIENEEEALDIGIEEYFDRDNWIFIEWPNKITPYIPKKSVNLTITKRHEFNILSVK